MWYMRRDLLRSIPCVRVWHWKMNFSPILILAKKVLVSIIMSLTNIKKHTGQPPRLFMMPSDWFQYWGMSHPDNKYYFVVYWLFHIKITWYVQRMLPYLSMVHCIVLKTKNGQSQCHTLTKCTLVTPWLEKIYFSIIWSMLWTPFSMSEDF